MMKNPSTNQDYDELLRLSVETYKSLRRKFVARVRWTPEFEVWEPPSLKSKWGKVLCTCPGT
jgi:hypothetical protein